MSKRTSIYILKNNLFTSQVDQMSHMPGNISESETNGMSETKRATFN